ncbi:MAG: (2Fe-2S)-binding protein [Chlorobi bacterium]|nr:(2Fe-2S)-binding protein [Chlorobiota bacterium]
MNKTIRFELNGEPVNINTNPENRLLWVLRNELGLTGTKYGCGIGACGACTIIIENEAVRACIYNIADVAGKKVLTIEGLAKNGSLHPLQKAFVENDALQCGFCTPGIIMNAYALLINNPDPARKEIIEGMDDNLCRCGTYGRIIEAIEQAGREMKGKVAV